MPTLRFARVETSLGPMWVVETDLGIAAVSRDEPFGALERRFPGSSVGARRSRWLVDRRRAGAAARCRRSTCAASRRSMPACTRSFATSRPARRSRTARSRRCRVTGCGARRRRRHVAVPALPGRAVPSGRACRRRLVRLGQRPGVEATAPGGGARYFLTLSASAASSAVGISPPFFCARLMSDSLLPTKTSSIRP